MVPKVGERLVRVDQRQAKRICQILLAIGHWHGIVLDQVHRSKPLMNSQQRPGDALAGVTLAERCDGLPQEMLFDRSDPCQVIGAGGLHLEQRPQVRPCEDAKPHCGRRFNGMLHFAHQPCLQPDEIAGEQKVDDLPLAIHQHFRPRSHAGENREKLRTVRPFHQHGAARGDGGSSPILKSSMKAISSSVSGMNRDFLRSGQAEHGTGCMKAPLRQLCHSLMCPSRFGSMVADQWQELE